MTTAELHEILDDENRKISLEEFRSILYELINDITYKQSDLLSYKQDDITEETKRDYRFYDGERNAFYIALDLSEHLCNDEEVRAEERKRVCEKIRKNLDITLEMLSNMANYPEEVIGCIAKLLDQIEGENK